MAGAYRAALPVGVPNGLNGSALQLGIRPEYVQTCQKAQLGWFKCTIISVNRTSNAQIVELESNGLTFKARIDQDAEVQPAQEMWANFPPSRTIIYADNRAIHLEDAIETGASR